MNKDHDIRHGLVVGKFCPLHKGHEEILNLATSRCENLFIISYTKPEFTGCGPEKRLQWLKALYPTAKILVLDDDLSKEICGQPIPHNDDDEIKHRDYCARLCRDYFKKTPDVIFTCETYGDGFASYLTDFFKTPIKHIMFGPQRAQDGISGTTLRDDIHGHKKYISPIVYADFIKTVCFLGAESTGKSTLSSLCAKNYQTSYVDEFGRTLWEEKNGDLIFDDMLTISRAHINAEQQALLSANKFLFVDTSPLTTLLYSLHMFGKAEPELYDFAQRQYDEVFLCSPDFPLVQDGTRQDESFRKSQHECYLQELNTRRIPYTLLQGPIEDRLEAVKAKLSQD